MRKGFVLVLPAVALLAVSLSGSPAGDPRMEQVENGLRPPVLVEGVTGLFSSTLARP